MSPRNIDLGTTPIKVCQWSENMKQELEKQSCFYVLGRPYLYVSGLNASHPTKRHAMYKKMQNQSYINWGGV